MYVSDETGAPQVYLRRYPSAGAPFMMLASTTSAPSQINVVLNLAQELERATSEN